MSSWIKSWIVLDIAKWVHERDLAGRNNRYSISINPKSDAAMYVYAWNSSNVYASTYHGAFGCYLFFEELLYSSSTAEYNEDGTELVSTTDNASGLKTQYEYDDYGRVTKTTVGQRITTNIYDIRDRVKRVASGNACVSYIYNGKNQLSYIKVSAGYGTQDYAFTYDTFGNNTKIMVGNYTLAQYSYIGNTGLMSGMTYGNNDSIAYTYDDDYRVIQTVYTDKNTLGTILGSKTVDYEYDLFGNLYRFTDGFTGNITTYNYDLLGRITGINKTGGLNRSITYDAFDRINGFSLSVLGKSIHSSVAYGDFGQVNSFTNTIGDREDKISYTYDAFYRQTKRKLEAINKTSEYTYLKGANGQDTVLVETLNNGKDTYKYTYDIYGNITSVAKNGTVVEAYVYDELNQLTQATIGTDVYTYTYDDRGNILSVRKGENSYVTYSYSNSNWKDLLTSYNGTTITYDNIGNPNNWRNNMSFDWEYGRRLKGVTKGSDSISYTYDADGLRTSKTVNGTKTEYYWLDGVLQGQKTGSEHIIFLYDENGTAYGMLIDNNGVEAYYYYLFNLQGDIVGMMDSTGATVVEYTYDPWGNWKSISGDVELANKNPLRYRGYYYDTETGFYYLQSRYYDPVVQRFINADGYVSTGTGLTGYNMFAYCNNNSIIHVDYSGKIWGIVGIVLVVGLVFTLSGCDNSSPTSKDNNMTSPDPVPEPEPEPEPELVPPSSASDELVKFIADYESFESEPYDDGYGNITIGYGHLIEKGEYFDSITQEEALLLLKNDISKYESMVTNYSLSLGICWDQNQYDAFVSLAYNSGNNFKGVMDDIIAGVSPHDAFGKLIYASNRKSLGLYRRRNDEANIFSKGIYERTYPNW